MIAPRRWWVAGLLSLLEPGLGQVYNGQARKGIALSLVPLLIFPFVYFLLLHNLFVVLLVGLAALIACYYLFVVADAVRHARSSGGYVLKRYNRWYVYVGMAAILTLLSSVVAEQFKLSLFQAFKISAASMEPTLLIGDHLLVDRRLSARTPSRGEVIVFQLPKDPKVDFIKRVAAIGGDTVELRDKVLLVNGEAVAESYALHKDERIIPAGKEPRDNYGPAVVPAESYFVLGDNRDNSFDSRYWGLVSSAQVKGRATGIYWSWDKATFSVRWKRIGEEVK